MRSWFFSGLCTCSFDQRPASTEEGAHSVRAIGRTNSRCDQENAMKNNGKRYYLPFTKIALITSCMRKLRNCSRNMYCFLFQNKTSPDRRWKDTWNRLRRLSKAIVVLRQSSQRKNHLLHKERTLFEWNRKSSLRVTSLSIHSFWWRITKAKPRYRQ